MTGRDRLRRVVLLCVHFARNLAYYRAGHDRLTGVSPQFWITVNGNFIDMAVIEWCKLFGDRRGKYYWGKLVTEPSTFEAQMLDHLAMTLDEFAAHIAEMRTYRDKFVAHLDDENVAHIPFLDQAWSAVQFYHGHVVGQVASVSRTYVALLEALNRHRGKGQQKVTVEHVHVHHGGQAIVGHVVQRGRG